MYHRRNQGDSRSTSSVGGSLSSSIPTTNSISTSSSLQIPSTGRVSIYSMRERVIMNKMTQIMGKLAPDTETEIVTRFHQEVPAIRLDGHLTYYLYMTIQNFIHLNTIYILLYHAIFWLNFHDSTNSLFILTKIINQTEYEKTELYTAYSNGFHISRKLINVNLINIYVYLALIGVSSIELLVAFVWTIRKKLSYFIQRNLKWRHRMSLLLIGMIILIYCLFIAWLLFHTFVTQYLTLTFVSIILCHFLFLILLDKSNLFQQSPPSVSKRNLSTSTGTRKQHLPSTSSSSTSSTTTTTTTANNSASTTGRLSYRSSTSTIHPRKVTSTIASPSISSSWSRWSSITEEKLSSHECSMHYAQARQEADDLWSSVVRRIALTFYRTLASIVLFDLIPLKTMDIHTRPIDTQPFKMLVLILFLSTFLMQSIFLFPIKLQTTLHRIATHLGQWRQQSLIRTEISNEWSPECNSYTRGAVVRLSTTSQHHYIAIQHLSNAADPHSIAHSILYRLFSDAASLLKIQCILCIFLIFGHIIWIIRGKHWEQSLIGCLIILKSSYTIFKIIRDRYIIEMADEHETTQIWSNSKQKKTG